MDDLAAIRSTDAFRNLKEQIKKQIELMKDQSIKYLNTNDVDVEKAKRYANIQIGLDMALNILEGK